jgi:predicted esterase
MAIMISCRSFGVGLFFTLLASHLVHADDQAQVQDITFTASCDGSEQKYVVLFPPQFRPAMELNVLIALHGHGSDRWQFISSDRDECRAARDVATERKMLYVSPDYRAKTSWMGPQAEADLVQIITDLKQQYQVRRVFLTGGSMGGSACLTFTALHPELVAGVASMNGTANHLEYQQFQEAIRESFGGSKAEKLSEYKLRSAEYWPEKFTMPVSLTTGGQDQLVPPDSVLRLAQVLQALGQDVLLVHRPQGGHATNYADARQILEYVLDRAK